MTTQILLVDDDCELCELVTEYLGRYGIEVSALHDAAHLERAIERERPDMIVLDISMPGIDGLTALRRLRGSRDETPVIILSGRTEEADRIAGLDLGADDYIGKPFNPRELLARVRTVLRRRSAVPLLATVPEQRKPLAFGRFVLDFQAHTLNVEDQVLILSASEFALLRIFVDHPMRTLTRERLSRLLHDPTGRQANRGIGVQVWRLRHIIESNPSSPRLIQTVRSHGYIFVPDGEQGGTMTVKTSKMPGEPQEPEGYGVDGLPDKLTGPY